MVLFMHSMPCTVLYTRSHDCTRLLACLTIRLPVQLTLELNCIGACPSIYLLVCRLENSSVRPPFCLHACTLVLTADQGAVSSGWLAGWLADWLAAQSADLTHSSGSRMRLSTRQMDKKGQGREQRQGFGRGTSTSTSSKRRTGLSNSSGTTRHDALRSRALRREQHLDFGGRGRRGCRVGHALPTRTVNTLAPTLPRLRGVSACGRRRRERGSVRERQRKRKRSREREREREKDKWS